MCIVVHKCAVSFGVEFAVFKGANSKTKHLEEYVRVKIIMLNS